MNGNVVLLKYRQRTGQVLRKRFVMRTMISKRTDEQGNISERGDLLSMLLNAEYEDGSKMSEKQLLDLPINNLAEKDAACFFSFSAGLGANTLRTFWGLGGTILSCCNGLTSLNKPAKDAFSSVFVYLSSVFFIVFQN